MLAMLALPSMTTWLHHHDFLNLHCVSLATTNQEGSRYVQWLLDALEEGSRVAVAEAFAGSVVPTLKSQHGNFVITKIVQELPLESLGFIVEELRGRVLELSTHRFACRALIRLVALHCRDPTLQHDIVDAVISEAPRLARNNYGHHVLDALVVGGTDDQRRRVLAALRYDYLACALHVRGSYTIQALLSHCVRACCYCAACSIDHGGHPDHPDQAHLRDLVETHGRHSATLQQPGGLLRPANSPGRGAGKLRRLARRGAGAHRGGQATSDLSLRRTTLRLLAPHQHQYDREAFSGASIGGRQWTSRRARLR